MLKAYGLTGVMGLLLASSIAQAAPNDSIWVANHFGKDFGVSVGLKFWSNQWDSPFELEALAGSTQASSIYTFESKTEVAAIPTFLVRYRNFFVGGSYLPEIEYNFDTQVLEFNGQSLADLSAEREEWDLNLGYFITPNLALSVGYKDLTRTLFFSGDINIEDKWEISVPIIGLAAAAPVGLGLNLYGNFAYGQAEVDELFGRLPLELEGDYYFGEVGLSYSVPLEGRIAALTLSAGYRFQRLDLHYTSIGANGNDPFPLGSSGDLNDSTHGVVFNLSATF